MRPARGRRAALAPAAVTLAALLVYLGSVLLASGGDPLAFVRIGQRYQTEGAVGSEGYDGQFVYYIARDPDPSSVAPLLDVPAYRYQRILMPLLGRLISAGNAELLPWALISLGLFAHLAGVFIVSRLLLNLGLSRWYALTYGLWPGLLLAVRLDLPEPLAYALVAAAILFSDKRPGWKWILFSLAVFAKEVTLLFVAGQLLAYARKREWRRLVGLLLTAVLPYALFQLWLLSQFGALGLGSGGAMATGFEWLPFMGYIRIAEFGWLPLLIFGVVILPFFYAPAVWGLIRSAVRIRSGGDICPAAYLFLNALVIPFLPFSTVREPGGLFRFGTGLVLSLLLFSARYKESRALRYAFIWLALNAVLLNSH